jgi:uncharacterized membrane protein
MILILYIFVILLISWGPFVLVLWLFFDMPFLMALLLGCLIGNFVSSLLNCFSWPKKKIARKSKMSGVVDK